MLIPVTPPFLGTTRPIILVALPSASPLFLLLHNAAKIRGEDDLKVLNQSVKKKKEGRKKSGKDSNPKPQIKEKKKKKIINHPLSPASPSPHYSPWSDTAHDDAAFSFSRSSLDKTILLITRSIFALDSPLLPWLAHHGRRRPIW